MRSIPSFSCPSCPERPDVLPAPGPEPEAGGDVRGSAGGQKAALKEAYEKNLSSLEAEQGKLGGNYQAARNDTAAQSDLSQQRFYETAVAYGLNSGTMGQAALSYATQLQKNLGTLQAAESAANAEIERQRTLLAKEYEKRPGGSPGRQRL